MTATIRDASLTRLDYARQLVKRRIRPDGAHEGWTGKDVLTHLEAYARLNADILRAEAEGRQATDVELYGRELTVEERARGGFDEVDEAIRREYGPLSYDEVVTLWRTVHGDVVTQLGRLTNAQLAAPGPTYPAHWSRPHLVGVVDALIQHYRGHMANMNKAPASQ